MARLCLPASEILSLGRHIIQAYLVREVMSFVFVFKCSSWPPLLSSWGSSVRSGRDYMLRLKVVVELLFVCHSALVRIVNDWTPWQTDFLKRVWPGVWYRKVPSLLLADFVSCRLGQGLALRLNVSHWDVMNIGCRLSA